MCALCLCVFFFFKQKTAYEMRISDWSSDVCSSDLVSIGSVVPVPRNCGGNCNEALCGIARRPREGAAATVRVAIAWLEDGHRSTRRPAARPDTFSRLGSTDDSSVARTDDHAGTRGHHELGGDRS